ncbi:MAG: PQQ-binding-like beta-propeller repeat protein [Alphaproteobacteria bacterium]|nr:PQQ-binding-like beta-propeller repeat protein [Alphaproteobacteria bacterium]
MTQSQRLTRRAALLLPLAATGCETLDSIFGTKKEPLPGKRIAVVGESRGLKVDNPPDRRIALPPPAPLPDSPQAGGNPSHVVGHPAVRERLEQAFQVSIGEGGGYRRKLTARPVVAGGRIFTMDSDAVVTAFDLKSGGRIWRTETATDEDDSTNVGGGIAVDGGIVYAATGLAEMLAVDAASGHIRWRKRLPTPARAAPTIAEDRLYIPTLDESLLAFAKSDGTKIWSFQGAAAPTSMLGLPSPAYADGLVVAGFGSGELVCLRAATGSVNWTDGLSAGRGRAALVEFSAIRGMPLIASSRVYAAGLGGLCVSLDLRSGRRLWEREFGSEQTMWLAGDWLFALTLDQQLVALNAEDGTVAWVTQLPPYEDMEKKKDPITWVGPALAGDRLIVAGSTKLALSVSPYTGKILGQQDLPGAASVAPVVAAGMVLLVTNDGSLLALR